MIPDLQDTIVALSSARGPGLHAIVRLSGPKSRDIAAQVFPGVVKLERNVRRRIVGTIYLPDVLSPLPADLYFWPGPHSYTGQDIVELHTLSCPPLIDHLIGQLLNRGARAALPGEFTLRAFVGGKMDLTGAEAVLGVIEAGSRDELKQALTQLAGGMAQPLEEVRNDLADLLAEIEANLDFAHEGINSLEQKALLDRITGTMAKITLAQKQLTQRAHSSRPFRVVLAGRPNAGKSSLFNAVAGKAMALTSPEPGTTRDYLVCVLDLDGAQVELVDTAGLRPAEHDVERQAQTLGAEQAKQADLILLCREVGKEIERDEDIDKQWGSVPVVGIATKNDLGEPPPGLLATSAATGAGLSALRELLREKAMAQAKPAMAPSWSRCRHHVDACLGHLRRAHAAALFEEPEEFLALELRGALEQLGELVGAVYTDELLDRIFSRFCIGK